MKQGLFAIIAALAALTAATSAYPGGSAKITVDQPAFSFGSIDQGKKVDHTYKITNKGNSPLTIERVRTSCGCTVAAPTSSKIDPGKSGDVRVTFDSTNFAGTVTKLIYIHSNDPQTPILTLSLTGTVVEKISASPRQLNLGAIKEQGKREAVISIENRGDKPLKITGVRTSSPTAVATVRKDTAESGSAAVILLTVTPTPSERSVNGYVIISTDNPVKREIHTPYFGAVIK